METTKLAPRFAWALELLPLTPASRVLELGCGHGVALREIAARLDSGRIVGVDRSPKMTAQARRSNAAAIRAGKVEVRTGTVATVELDAGPFDLAFAINVALFGRSADAELRRLRGALVPGGAVYLLLQAPAPGHVRSFLEGAARNLRVQGFDVERLTRPRVGVCVIGRLRG